MTLGAVMIDTEIPVLTCPHCGKVIQEPDIPLTDLVECGFCERIFYMTAVVKGTLTVSWVDVRSDE